MRVFAVAVLLVFVAPSAMARIDVGGNSKGECDDRRQPNAQYCVYFGNPYYDSATRTFTNNINPYYDNVSGTFSSFPPRGGAIAGPRKVRRYAP
jgi:hypothetical protein